MAFKEGLLYSDFQDHFIDFESFGEYLYGCINEKDSKEVASIVATTKEKLTYGQLLEETVKTANAFKKLNLQKGDVIVLIEENTLRYCIPLIAATYLGIIVNPINPAYTTLELEHVFNITKPKAVLCCETVAKTVLRVKEKCNFIHYIILIDSKETLPETIALESLVSSTQAESLTFPKIHEDDCCFILLSSGTTGFPKGVVISHKNLKSPVNCLIDEAFGGLNGTHVSLAYLPFFHIFGLMIQLLGIIIGMKMVLVKFKPDLFLQAIQDYKVTALFCVPSILLFITKTPLFLKYNVSSINKIIVGAAPVSKAVVKETAERIPGVQIQQVYGLTESSGPCSFQRSSSNDDSAGVLVPKIIAKVWDNHLKKIVGPMEVGELCFKGPMIVKGYYANEEATRQCIDEEGFLHTGDIGYYDEKGNFYIVDRMKELIKYKGFQVAPAELETLILTHPGVKECGVIGIPDERAGQLPLAFIVTQNETIITENEIVDYVAERISPQKHLYGGVIFVKDLPKSSTSKILRRELLEMYKKCKKGNTTVLV